LPFILTAPVSNSGGEFTYISSNPLVATISGNTVTIIGIGSTIITATQAAFGEFGPGSISTTFIVYEDAIELASNNVTYRYKKISAPSGTSNPYFTSDASGAFYAVMRDSQDSIDKIRAYANGSNTDFSYNGTLIPFDRIVTTLMTSMSNMFNSVTNFNQPIGSWDTSNVTNMSQMFEGASAFNQPIGSWNTANVISMSAMFFFTAFNQPLDSWNTANVRDMTTMFLGCSEFNQPLNSWNTANVLNMQLMFRFCSNFNQPLDSWNTANVLNMNYMFNVASNFNQDISGWDVTNVTLFTSFRTSSLLTNDNTPSKFVLAGE
jgi:surface protein